MSKDWIGNSKSIYTTLGASNHVKEDRAENDYYATDPRAIDYLINDGGVIFRGGFGNVPAVKVI